MHLRPSFVAPSPGGLSLLAGALFVLGLGATAAAAADIAWEVRLLSADYTMEPPERAELLLDLGGDPLDHALGVRQGTLLAHATGLPLGRTRDDGGRTVVLPLEESFSVSAADRGLSVSVDARADGSTHGRLVAELRADFGAKRGLGRSVPLAAHRARLWVVPGRTGVHAVLIEAWPEGEPPRVPEPRDTVSVELALVRGQWGRGADPALVPEADFATWVDPFRLRVGDSAAALMRPVASGHADAGELVFKQGLRVALEELVSLEHGLRPGPAGEAAGAVEAAGGKAGRSADADAFVGATLSMREGDRPGGLLATLSLQSAGFGAPALVRMRRVELEPGSVHAWVVPTDEALLALFIRAQRGLPGLAQAVRPGPDAP